MEATRANCNACSMETSAWRLDLEHKHEHGHGHGHGRGHGELPSVKGFIRVRLPLPYLTLQEDGVALG